MGRVTYVEHDGREHAIEIEDGVSVMRGAVDNGVPGIDADCGGMCACATCHVHVAPDWFARTGGPGVQEGELLELAPERDETSRLSCQIAMRPALDGLVVRLPISQH
ncbi:2Fe-2S iron-sulfur cluster-binding protein [uncultured Sphingomonas sp.]|uniref:2Fe-2S iron-sulfur cluster-binding protein n=1 Tax=uncultured Sphingomonas sp. TaxID=158754 RepID=UPI0035CBC3FB